MARPVVMVEPDPFLGAAENAAAYIPNYYLSDSDDNNSSYISKMKQDGNLRIYQTLTASRPLSGIQAKPNTHAIVEVKRADGTSLQVFNRLGRETEDGQTIDDSSSTGYGPNSQVWTDWLLQGVHEERAEKTQIVETFGDTYLYAFGQRPRVLAFTGILMNTSDYNWRAIFWENWDKYFRATQLVRANARMYIYFDEILVEGYPLNAAADQSSSDRHVISFNFTFFVTNYINLTASSGFAQAREEITEVVRAGYADNASDFSYIAPSRRLLDLIPGLSKFEVTSSTAGSVLLGNASDNLARAINIASGTTNPKQLTSAPLSMALDQLSIWREQGIRTFEDTYGVVPGDTNTWFGFLAQILADNAPTVVGSNPVSRFALQGGTNKNSLSYAIQEGLDPSNALGQGAKAYGIFVTGG